MNKQRNKLKSYNQVDIGERIKLIRIRAGLNVNNFSKELGFSQGAMGNIEKGDYGIGLHLFHNICKKFKISADWLLFGAGEMSSVGKLENDIKGVPALKRLKDEVDRLRKEMVEITDTNKKLSAQKKKNDGVIKNYEAALPEIANEIMKQRRGVGRGRGATM